MTTITFLIGNLSNSGGTQRMLSLLCNELVKFYYVQVFVHSDGAPFFFLDKKVKIIVLKGNLLKKNLQIYKFLQRSKSKYYINLDSNSVLFNGFLLPSFTKLIVWEHFSIANNYKRWLFTFSRLYAVKRVFRFIVLSDFESAKWQKLYQLPKQKILKINNPITIDKKKITTDEKYAYKTLLCIGNSVKVKGFDLLLKAWKEIKTDWNLKIVGLSENEIGNLQGIVEEEKLMNVEMYPKAADISQFYQNAAVFVLSSRKEATPLVLIESQAFGVPVICFNHIESVKEIAKDSVLYADFGKPVESLKETIEKIINSKQLYLDYWKRSLTNSKVFDKDLFVERWMKLLE